MPTSPNSLTRMAHVSSAGRAASNPKIDVVFPAPKNPVTMLTGMFLRMRHDS